MTWNETGFDPNPQKIFTGESNDDRRKRLVELLLMLDRLSKSEPSLSSNSFSQQSSSTGQSPNSNMIKQLLDKPSATPGGIGGLPADSPFTMGGAVGGGTAPMDFGTFAGGGFSGAGSGVAGTDLGAFTAGGGAGGETGLAELFGGGSNLADFGGQSLGSNFVESGTGSGTLGGSSFGSFATPAFFAALIGMGKNTEANHPDTALGKGLLGMLGPSAAQIFKDPKGMGLPTLLGAPFLTPFTGSKEARHTRPEWSGLFGLGF